ncbi:hypothetical protein ACP81E_23965 [Escherichia coli]|uniref:hypothetical protein n=1 Tax=Escherichia coli TaxID=562 RepID=UPI000E063BC4|nr:hypothetical protein [Escherichia coli]MEC6239933.1 hypothetical protein [Escherichia coli]STN91855.1 Uncharacterised protein [Escherichia coli]HAI2246614.1 hypothetical protein [Escherichia coli]HDP5106703.1 hypothetical protein [Escherichia coli]
MASLEEKLLSLLLSTDHLRETAVNQQKAVADTLAVSRETLKEYRKISESVAEIVRDEVRQEVKRMNIAGMLGERFKSECRAINHEVGEMKTSAEMISKNISAINRGIVEEYNTLAGYSTKWFMWTTGAFAALFLLLFAGLYFISDSRSSMVKENYKVTLMLYQKVTELESKFDGKAESSKGTSRKQKN